MATANTTVNGAFPVTITWNEAVSGLSSADFRVTNGQVTALSGNGLLYTATVLPAAPGVVTVRLPAAAAMDVDGLSSLASNTLTVNATQGGTPGGGAQNADVELAMVVDRTDVPIYSRVTFTLTARNTGNLKAENIRVEFPVLYGTSFVESNASQGSYQAFTANWDVGTIEAGEAATLRVTLYTLSTDTRTAYAQVIAMRQFDPDSTPGNGACCVPVEDDEAAVTINGAPVGGTSADLAVAVTSSQRNLGADGTFHARITVRNDGPNATSGIMANIIVSTGVALISSTIPSGTQLNGANWNVGRLNIGESRSLIINYRAANPTAGASVTAEIQSSSQADPDSTPGNGRTDEDDYAVLRLGAPLDDDYANLRLKMWSSVSMFRPNRNVTLTLTLENKGNLPSLNNVVTFPVPAGTSFTSFSANQSTYDQDFGTWTIPRLGPGEGTTLRLTVLALRAEPAIVAFGQVTASDTRDVNSSPNNRQCCSPVEDDEVMITIRPWPVVQEPSNESGPIFVRGGGDPVYGFVQFHPQVGGAGQQPIVGFTTEQAQTNATLVDALGRSVRTLTLAEGVGTYRVPVDLSGLPGGIYHLVVETNEGPETIRLVNPR